MARKPAAKKQENSLPKGYSSISGFGKSWPNDDTKVGDMVTGVLGEYDTFTVMRGKKKQEAETYKLETSDGLYTLWNSAGLKGLFEYEEGTEVAIIYRGLGKAKAGQNAPKLFDVGVKE